jgi:hypothetical protein
MLPTRPPDAFVAAASVREGVEDLGYFCGAANPEMQWTLCAPDGHLRGAGAAPTAYVRLILGEYASAAQTHRLLGVHVRSENSDGSDPLMRALEEFDGVIDLAMDPALAESAKSWVHERIGRSTGRKGESTRIGTVELNLAASPTYKFLAISLVGTRADWESKRPYVAAEPLRDHLIRLGYRCPPPSTATTIRCWRGDERNGDHADLYLAEFDDRARTHRVSRVDWQWQSEHDSELTTEARAKEREEFGPFIALALEPRHADRVREYALTAWRPAVVVGPVLMRIIDGPRDVRGIDIDFDW